MAAIHVNHSQASLSVMQSARRAPLSSKPNAANSPFRNLISGKRSRQATHVDAADYGDDCQQPPLKRQAYESTNDENRAPRALTRQSAAQDDPEATAFFSKRPSNAPVTTLGRKLHAAASASNSTTNTPKKHSPAPQRSAHSNNHHTTTTNTAARNVGLDNLKQWQDHYRKAFPTFVFFFDSVPEDIQPKLSRYVQHLGAEELKFFSDQVTHVVTTRTVPSDVQTSNTNDADADGSKRSRQAHDHRTIDPSLLGTQQNAVPPSQPSRAVQLLQSTLRIRGNHHSTSRVEPKKPSNVNAPMDVLVKAREFKQKIWTVEKLQRILETMARVETSSTGHEQHAHRHNAVAANYDNRVQNEADLQRLVRNEKIIGPADRDLSAAGQDMMRLRGIHLYIHDIDEKTRPVMVREYEKPEESWDGKWPQFRATSAGRCPFVPEPKGSRRVHVHKAEDNTATTTTNTNNTNDNGNDRVQAAGGRRPEIHQGIPRTRSRVAELCKPDQDNHPAPQQAVLVEASANVRRSPRKQDQKPFDPPPIPASKQHTAENMPPLYGSAQVSKRGLPRIIAGEPVASGVQPSNVTSAIRSQAISSTAISSAVTGMRAGTSKEIHALQRKVLERGGTTSGHQSMASSYINDVRAALNGDAAPTAGPPQRAAKRKAQESLVQANTEAARPHKIRHTKSAQAVVQKEAKPGYCENCNEKFDDFEEHTFSRKHRKFSLTNTNFTELDMLLQKLQHSDLAIAWTSEL